MSLARNPGRVPGLWYLLLVVLGPLRLIYIPSRLFPTEDPATIVQNLAGHALLFRAGVASEVLAAVVLIMLTMAFYRLFREVNQNAAVLVVLFGGVMPAILDFFIAALDLQSLEIARRPEFLSGVGQAQREAAAALLISLGNHSNTAAEMLWGVWLLPLGYLVYKSRFLPRFIGLWLLLNGAAYVAVCLTGIFAPEYQGRVFNDLFPLMLGEIVLMLWLVIRGARPPALAGAEAR